MFPRLIAVAATVAFASCARYASVSEVRPHFHPAHSEQGIAGSAHDHFARAGTLERRAPLTALAEYLSVAEGAAKTLATNPGNLAARDTYNFAVARVFTTIHKGHLNPWTQPLRIPIASGGSYLLTNRPPKTKVGNPALYEFTPADQFDIKGSYVTERTIKPGIGAPLVATGKDPRQDAATEYAPTRTFYGVTAVAHFSATPDRDGTRRVEIAFDDPLAVETVTLAGRRFPLAADFTVPLAVMLAREDPKKLELARLLRPEKYAQTAHVTRLQPYDPNKTVVIVTHGLADSPATWTPMLNTLRGDPVIRNHFQFWFYSYPSGYPYPYSAAIMRRELDGIEKRFPLSKKVVLIGHSMGSLISRLMITDSGDRIWLNAFKNPPGRMKMTAHSRKLLEESLIFRHRPEVGRVIFISAPHRGSELATNWVGRLGSRLVKAPQTLATVANEARKAMVADSTVLHLRGVPNSVDTLAPNNRFVKVINTIPITPGIPYHSIMGDRGKGGNKDRTKPVSSDGVVPYWSSHLDGAQSELVVPSNHSAHQNKQAIAEVARILRLHAGASDAR